MVKLLIVTQKVDRADPILGFFHRWIEEFAKHYESVVVIAQSVGDFSRPHNVNVESLKKEEGLSRIAQVLRFRKLLKEHRNDFDAAFVHMTPIWVVLGWPWRKSVYLWYEARGARWPLKLALKIVKKVFSASDLGMPVKTSKSVITGHGIDLPYLLSGPRDPTSLVITVGRITVAKRLPIILNAFSKFPNKYRLRIAGIPITHADQQHLNELYLLMKKLNISDRIEIKPVKQQELGSLIDRAAIFLHASKTGLDKALLEAMGNYCLVVSCSEAAQEILPKSCISSPENMADTAIRLLNLPENEQDDIRFSLRDIVDKHHSLPRLIDRLVKEMR